MSEREHVAEPDPTPSAPESNATPEAPSDLDQVRELILASHTDIVPELVQGETVADLVASIGQAQEAYSRIVDSRPNPVTIPAGGNMPVTLDINALPTAEKLRRGLAEANRP